MGAVPARAAAVETEFGVETSSVVEAETVGRAVEERWGTGVSFKTTGLSVAWKSVLSRIPVWPGAIGPWFAKGLALQRPCTSALREAERRFEETTRHMANRLYNFFGEFPSGRVGWALLLLRAITGIGIMQHGLSKIQAPFTWMNRGGEPSAVPGFLQALAAVGEFGGGAALLLGFLTPLGALGVGATMIGAILIAHRGDPWINPGGKSWELASLYLLISAVLLLSGPGRYSLDATIFKKRTPSQN
jgi:putative oxidoreductase